MKIDSRRSAALCVLCIAPAGFADDTKRLVRSDHYVQVQSSVPAISGQITQIYVREVVEADTIVRGGARRPRGAVHSRRGHACGGLLRRPL